MKKLTIALALALLLCGCGPAPAASAPQDGELRVLCTTYPVYLLTTAVTQGVEGVEVSLLVNSRTSCLHDYTLTVSDMKAIEKADVVVMNGAGLEDFMADALSHADAAVIDCSAGIDLLEPVEEDHDHEGHGHGEEADPHIWMDPANAGIMAENAAAGLAQLLPAQQDTLMKKGDEVRDRLAGHFTAPAPDLPLITFHDGFRYFANAFGLELVKAIEEEEGATAPASEIREIVALIGERHIPAVFTEKNGSDATARAIAAETGCQVLELDMIMSGEGTGLEPYLEAMDRNLAALSEALS